VTTQKEDLKIKDKRIKSIKNQKAGVR